MKHLYLLRHAHTLKMKGDIDIARRLSDLGVKQSNELGNYLNNLPQIDLIKLSSARRTQETCFNFCKTLKHQPQTEVLQDLYYADPEDIIRIIRETDESITSLMILSHNPSITQVTNLLNVVATEQQLNQAMNFEPTAKLVLMECKCKSWNDILTAKKTIKDVYCPEQK